MTEAIYIETYVAQRERRISVSGVLQYLGVSRNGYLHWLNKKPSQQEIRKKEMINKIQVIHNESHQSYGAPKIAVILKRAGNIISERTVGHT